MSVRLIEMTERALLRLKNTSELRSVERLTFFFKFLPDFIVSNDHVFDDIAALNILNSWNPSVLTCASFQPKCIKLREQIIHMYRMKMGPF